MPFFTLLWIIVIAGAIGGIANYFLDKESDEYRGYTLWRRVILGIVAAGAVPVLLYLIRSDLMDFTKDGNCTDLVSNCPRLWAFGSMCLVAATFSSSFLTSVSKRLFDEIEKAKKEAKESKAEAEEAKQRAKGAEERAAQAEELSTDLLAASTQHTEVAQEVNDRIAMEKNEDLNAILDRVFKKHRGIIIQPTRFAADLPDQVTEEKVQSILNDLVDKGEYKVIVRGGRQYYMRNPGA